MIKIGLTGGIGSGKSTVSFMLKEAGFNIIDADIIAREVLVKYPEILERVRIEFGSGFFDWRGDFRRKEFGNHIFRFPKQRKKQACNPKPHQRTATVSCITVHVQNYLLSKLTMAKCLCIVKILVGKSPVKNPLW